MSAQPASVEVVQVRVNGELRAAPLLASTQVLADFLRDDCGATDVKVGCREGACGACTVLLDGNAVVSCLVPLPRAAGCDVRTADHLAETGIGQRVVDALVTHRALQCGFCTPGVLTAIYGMLATGRVAAIDAGNLRGHLCRCTGYERILAAAASLTGVDGLDEPAQLP
jgi:aerobic-type carbon monoxide dehydrogenase small subunit (CoxS/CutS family)